MVNYSDIDYPLVNFHIANWKITMAMFNSYVSLLEGTLILDPCLIVGYSGYGSKTAMDPSLVYGSWVCFQRLRKFGRSHMGCIW